jgi:phosphate transport system substrate-binding protein
MLLAASCLCAHAAFDSADLPAYKPEVKIAGVIRNHGFGFGGLLKEWEEGFGKHHPQATFSDVLVTSDAAFPAMVAGVTDLAPDGGEPALTEWLSFYETFGYHATDIVVASGTYDVDGRSPGVVVYVHPDNPLKGLTLKQLDGIFSAERTGGLDGFKWDLKRGRGPDGNIRTWGQLGLGGEWADKGIQTYGHAPSGTTRFFQARVLGNSDKWNPNYREYVETGSKMIADDDRVEQRGSVRAMLNALKADKYGIAWTVVPQAKLVPGLKPVALAVNDGGAFVQPGKETFRDRSYPLVRNLYFYVNRKPGDAMDPKSREFLRYVLSRDGQQAIVANGNYLPLPLEMVRENVEKLGPVLSGVIRTWGHGRRGENYIGTLTSAWESGYRKRYPGVRFETSLLGDKSAIGGLYTGATDLALMERELSAIEKDSYEQIFGRTDPFAVTVATGSLDVANHAPALVVFVHKDNPIEKLTLAQLDAVFGADHRRGPRNIRTWGQLGLPADWSAKTIRAYGLAIPEDTSQFFQRAVMGGSQKWTGNLTELATGREVTEALAGDRHGIAISHLQHRNPSVKPVAIALEEGGPYYQATRETVLERKYPLARPVFVYLNREPGKPFEPKVKEYLRYILGAEGQVDIARDGGYLPLTPAAAREELTKVQ